MNKTMNDKTKHKKKQQGATLAMGLVLLLIMTLIGVTSMKTTALQEKMAGSLRNKALALSGVESALREGESYLWNYFSTSNGVALVADTQATFGVFSWEAPDALAFRSSKRWVDIGTEFRHNLTDVGSASLKKNPRFIIEEAIQGEDVGLAEFGDDGYGTSAGILKTYRVTARSMSGDGKITEIAESIFTTRTK
jgi:type IV pilus assembly protein PilX